MFLKNIFNKKNISIFSDPSKFKLKLVPIWNDSYVEFHWSINNGLTWNVIKTCSRDGCGCGIYDMYSMQPVRYKIHFYSENQFEPEKRKWSTYDLVMKYHNEQLEMVSKNNQSLLAQQKEYNNRKKNIISKFN